MKTVDRFSSLKCTVVSSGRLVFYHSPEYEAMDLHFVLDVLKKDILWDH